MKTNSNELALSCFTTCKVMTVCLFYKNCTINIVWWKIKSVSASKSVTTGPNTFKDSFCFLPFSLASFPKAFELVDLKKGFFPHLFNTPENQSYVGPIPPSDTYDPDSMNHDKRHEFLSWYQDQVRRRVLHFWCQVIESGLPKISRRIFSRGAI